MLKRWRLSEYNSMINYKNSKKIHVYQKMSCKHKTMQNKERKNYETYVYQTNKHLLKHEVISI